MVYAGSGNDHIYGNAGFNIDLSRSLAQAIAGNHQILTVISREGESFHTSPREGCVFVPLVGREGWDT